jgi:FtsP/CotA-like multicopper oxidase with cupredoxin domain
METTDTATATGDVVEISLIVGENTGPDMKQTVSLGASVRITVTNPNGPDEIHVHGYDISTGEMAKGQEAVIEFVASNAGTFDLESHVSEEIVLILTVE